MNMNYLPANPAVGQRSQQWGWGGSPSACAVDGGFSVITTVFTASGTYTPSPGLVSLVVKCIGGGGGGGPAGPTTANTVIAGGGGGGSGGYSEKTLPASLVAGGVVVTVGAGGPGGGVAHQPGGNGLATTFGALCVANGGMGGGFGDAATAAGAAGAGGAPGTGDVAFPGMYGANGQSEWLAAAQAVDVYGAAGGAMWGGNATQGTSVGGFSGGADALPNTGSGAQGGIINQDTGAGTIVGGTGGSGLCIVTEYCGVVATNPCAGARVSSPWCPPGGWDCC